MIKMCFPILLFRDGASGVGAQSAPGVIQYNIYKYTAFFR